MPTRIRHSRPFLTSWLMGGRIFLVLLLGLLLVSTARADLNGYLTLEIEGVTIEGGSEIAPHEGKIVVHAVSHSGFSPVDAAGRIGAPQHRPITLLKPLDRATPLLWQAWANSSTIDNAIIEFYRPGSGGAEENYLVMQLSGGAISSIALGSPDNLDPDLMSRPATELITLTYQSISWTTNAGTTAREGWGGGN